MAVEQLITEHMETWTGAVREKKAAGRGGGGKRELYGVKKLRELILEFAVQGLLVEQDLSDEPAQELLNKIMTKREKLVAEKRIRKPRKWPELDLQGSKELPSNWVWTQLGAIAEIAPRNDITDDKSVGFVPMPLISTSHRGEHGFEERAWQKVKKGFTHFSDGDVGLAKITPCFENSKAAVFTGLPNGYGAGTTELHIARPLSGTLNPLYVLLYLKAPMFLEKGKTEMTGSAGQKRIPAAFFAANPFPLPPLAEQHRIVAKVDELMALCDQLEQQQENSLNAHQTLVQTLLGALTTATEREGFNTAWARVADHFHTLFTTPDSIQQLRQTLLQLAVMGRLIPQQSNEQPAKYLVELINKNREELVGSGATKAQKKAAPIADDERIQDLPPGWGNVRISQIALVGTGATPPRDQQKYYQPKEHRWLTSGETSADYVDDTKEWVSEKAVAETNVSIYPKGTLVIAMYGQGKTRGQITELRVPAGTNQACAAIQLLETSPEHRRYIKLFFQKAYAEIRLESAGGAQPNLNLSKVSKVVIPLPPLAEQHRIVAKVDELMALCDRLQTVIEAAQTTRLQLADAVAQQAVS